ncbi:hypothetical protein AB1283_00705 [Bacillus sp. S13(2024)]|uniref:hypothetical protein n=1 Tax=Bacillus sp. S13(2024) TaxID=3162885 RepID=UPI003D1AC960
MKHKLLCDRCGADKYAFRMYTSTCNNGRCHKCNGHGYILTKNELKAKESHMQYIDTLTRNTKAIEIASNKEIQAMKELKTLEGQFKEENKDLYGSMEILAKQMNEKINKDEQQKIISQIIDISNQINDSMTKGYKFNIKILKEEINSIKKEKEICINELLEAQQFYMELLKPVE